MTAFVLDHGHEPYNLIKFSTKRDLMASKTIDNAFTAKALKGAATDPTYAGVLSFMRRKYSKDLTDVDAVVLGIPFDAAVSNRPGARFGPQAIRRASAIFDNDPQYPFARDLFEQMAVIDYGDVLLDYGNHQKTPALIEEKAAEIIASGAYLLGLGGDHFVTWPLLKAMRRSTVRWRSCISMPIRIPGTMTGSGSTMAPSSAAPYAKA